MKAFIIITKRKPHKVFTVTAKNPRDAIKKAAQEHRIHETALYNAKR